MIAHIAQAIVAFLFLLLVPGYLLSILIYPRLDWAMRIVLSVGFSIAIDVVTGIILMLTRHLDAVGVWVTLVGVSVGLLATYLIKGKRKRKKGNKR